MKNNILILIVIAQFFLTMFDINGFSKYKLDVIVIDAGHGGKDPGSIGKISYEKDITLKIALHLGRIISENLPDVKVIYTRNNDNYPTFNKRAQMNSIPIAGYLMTSEQVVDQSLKAYSKCKYLIINGKINKFAKVVTSIIPTSWSLRFSRSLIKKGMEKKNW